jgi:membrane protein DedA with SNARE-associated domain
MLPTFIDELVRSYGLWILFIGIMLEALGVPLPGETALVSAALYAASTDNLAIGSVILVAALAATIGGTVGYAIGRSIGLPLLVRYGRYVRLDERRLKIGEYLFLRHGGKIVFFGRFVALLRTFAALLAGANRMSLPRFLLMNAAGGVVWAAVFGTGAYLLGEQIKRVTGPITFVLLIVAIGLVIAGVIYFRRHERELEQRAELAIADAPVGGQTGATDVSDSGSGRRM